MKTSADLKAEILAALAHRQSSPCLDGGELVTPEGRFAIDLALHDPALRARDLDRDGIDSDKYYIFLTTAYGFGSEDLICARIKDATRQVHAHLWL